MGNIKSSIIKVFRSSSETFRTYPASIGCALAFAIVTMVRIQLDWPEQEAYNFLFNCLHLAFALGAVFSLASITAARSRSGEKKAFMLANLLGGGITILAFILLYTFSGREPASISGIVLNVTELASVRISVAIVVSLIAFIYLAGFPKEESDFSRSLFMFHKAFFIAAIYSAVIMAGTSGVAGAVQALLYRDMSEKVYMYLGTVTGFLAFTIFVGYFPDFTKGMVDDHREIAQKQPKFIEVLLQYIMVPIALALTAVLLLWTGKTVLSGTWPSFMRLAGIATSYAVIGIWLHIMVTHHETGFSAFFRRIYPWAALLILAFEARALILQLSRTGLKVIEYNFILIWILAVAVAVLLLVKKEKSHPVIAALICAATIFAVLPVVGYHVLPVRAQVSRLETLLVSENMLKDERLVPAAIEPARSVREDITDAVEFLNRTDDESRLPTWFDRDLYQKDTFEASMGFGMVWPEQDNYDDNPDARRFGTSLMLPNGVVDISDYTWSVFLSGFETDEEGRGQVDIEGERGEYSIIWERDGEPTLMIYLDGELILEEGMGSYLNQLAEQYPDSDVNDTDIATEDLSLVLGTQEVTVLLIFRHVSVNLDIQEDEFFYWTELNALYMKENE
jgi:hypothetical protein